MDLRVQRRDVTAGAQASPCRHRLFEHSGRLCIPSSTPANMSQLPAMDKPSLFVVQVLDWRTLVGSPVGDRPHCSTACEREKRANTALCGGTAYRDRWCVHMCDQMPEALFWQHTHLGLFGWAHHARYPPTEAATSWNEPMLSTSGFYMLAKWCFVGCWCI